jgi:Ca-activated chloride channel family protein
MPSDLTFHNPEAFWLLLLVPALAYWSWRRRRARPTLRFSAAHVFAARSGGLRPYLVGLLPLFRLVAVTAAVIALARPQLADARTRDLSVEGIDIVIALDLSSSMEAGDFKPHNRLYVAKDTLGQFIDGRKNDRIGLVVFAGAAYTQAPLTLDYAVLKEIVSQLKTRVLEDGTAIGDAIATSLNRLRGSHAKSRVVVLITDGDNNAGQLSPLDSAKMAKALKIPVYTILVGKGGKVPFPAGKDLFGNTVWREMEIAVDPTLLQQIAKLTGGEYYRATDAEELKSGLQHVLDSLEKSKLVEGGATANYTEAFSPFLALAFLLAAAELLLRATWLKVFP